MRQVTKDEEEQSHGALCWCAQHTGCQRSMAATCLPAKFTLAVVRGKFKDYLCCYLFLFQPPVETIVLGF